jgi:hypothetical protein
MVTSVAENRCRRSSPASFDPRINEDGHVLKSRRGLLAAGLAVAVVGAMGAASILSASADEIPGAADTSAAAASADSSASDAAAAGHLTPPALLPWGAKPTRIRKGKAGASSSSLRAAGLVAAAPAASGSSTPTPAYASKGRIAPPAPPVAAKSAVTAKAAASDQGNFFYNVGNEYTVHDGLYATLTINKPSLAPGDAHSLAELALQSEDGNQIVEIGWTVDPEVNKYTEHPSDPHLFVYHWVNHDENSGCYNGCGFIPYVNKSNITAGAALSSDTTSNFGIKHFQGAWWLGFASEWIGAFPDALWAVQGVTFTQSGLMQAFGEVNASSATPCTDMGNGILPTSSAGAYFSNVAYVDVDPSSPTGAVTQTVQANLAVKTTSDVYPKVLGIKAKSGNQTSFRYGGPGAC